MATQRIKPETYAIAISTFQRQRPLLRTANADLFIATLLRYREAGKFRLHGFVVMPDHAHVLITPAMDVSTAKAVQLIEGGYSFAVREQAPGEIWHSGYHEHRVRDVDDFEAQKQYIANNPVRKRYAEYPHVHTRMMGVMDGVPEHLVGGRGEE